MKGKVEFNLNNQDLSMLPSNTGLEKCVLGLILDIPDLFNVAYKYMNVKGMFYSTQNEQVWLAMCAVVKSNVDAGFDNVTRHFEGNGDKKMVAYLFSLKSCSDTPAYFYQHCLKLNEFWIRRAIIRAGFYLNQNGLDREKDSLELLNTATSGINKLYLHISKMKDKTLKDGADELESQLVEIAKTRGGIIGVRSSINGLNNVIHGYRPGNMIVLAAGTGEGKTTFAIQEAYEIANNGEPVGYISLEMKTSELIFMMACRKTGINSDDALSGNLSPEELSKIGSCIDMIRRLPIQISESPALSIGEIRALATMWKEQYGIKILFIDHLHLVKGEDPKQNAEQRFNDIANEIKALAKELNIPVIPLAQFSRRTSAEEKRAHQISDLKYASGIEQAADIILMLYRPEYYGIEATPDGESTAGYGVIIVGKLRLLKKRNVKVRFSGTGFEDWNNGSWKSLGVSQDKYF